MREKENGKREGERNEEDASINDDMAEDNAEDHQSLNPKAWNRIEQKIEKISLWKVNDDSFVSISPPFVHRSIVERREYLKRESREREDRDRERERG